MSPGAGREAQSHAPVDRSQNEVRRESARPERHIGSAAVLAVQRLVGNRATGALLAREVVSGGLQDFVRFRLGHELSAAFAALAWKLTEDGPLTNDGIRQLRELALTEQRTVDDDDRMFIAGLLDARTVSLLHAKLPHGFAPHVEGSDEYADEIEVPVSWISEANRNFVRDFGRFDGSAVDAKAAAKGGSAKAAATDAAIIRMAGSFGTSMRQTLALADAARIPHDVVYTAMVAAASDSTPGDRAMAAAVYVIARKVGMSVAEDILAGRIKVDETAPDYIGARIAAVYETGGTGRKGDTVYVPTDFDVSDLDQQGTVVHELTHAIEDKEATAVSLSDADRLELRAFRAQAHFYLEAIRDLDGAQREAAVAKVAPTTGQVRLYSMILEANEAPSHADYNELLAVIVDINQASGTFGAGSFRTAISAAQADVERWALGAVRTLERLKPGQQGQNDGLSGESVLDWKYRTLSRSPRTLARDDVVEQQKQATWPLIYRDKFGDTTDENGLVNWRPIALDDKEFLRDFVDDHIVYGAVKIVIDEGRWESMDVLYSDGRRRVYTRDMVPSSKRVARPNGAKITRMDQFEKREEDGFIYPALGDGTVALSDQVTPNLVSIRDQADYIASQLQQLRQLAEIAAAFASIIAMYSSVVGSLHVEEGHAAGILEISSRNERETEPPRVLVESEPTSKPKSGPPEEPVTPMAIDPAGEPGRVPVSNRNEGGGAGKGGAKGPAQQSGGGDETGSKGPPKGRQRQNQEPGGAGKGAPKGRKDSGGSESDSGKGEPSHGEDQGTTHATQPSGTGTLTIEPGANLTPSERHGTEHWTEQGLNVRVLQPEAEKGAPGPRTADIEVQGVGRVDIYSPEAATSANNVVRGIVNKSSQAPVVQVELPAGTVITQGEIDRFPARVFGNQKAGTRINRIVVRLDGHLTLDSTRRPD